MTDQPKRRLRVAHVLVQPVLVWDDGEHLYPGPQAGGAQVSVADLPGLPERLRGELLALEEQAASDSGVAQ